MAERPPCTKGVTAKETVNCFYMESKYYTDCPECRLVVATRNSLAAFGRHFGDDLERSLTCLRVDTQNGWTNGARQHHESSAFAMFLLLRWIKLNGHVAYSEICVQRYSCTRN
jgi:hypothetical protein